MERKPTEILHESPQWNDCGSIRKVVFGKFTYRTLTVFTREQKRFFENTGWETKEIEYSLDKLNWKEWQEIYRESKKLGL